MKKPLSNCQDNKMTIVCEKLNLGKEDRFLDIGCVCLASPASRFASELKLSPFFSDVDGALWWRLPPRITDATRQALQSHKQGLRSETKESVITAFPPIRLASFVLTTATSPSDKKFTKIASLEMAEVGSNAFPSGVPVNFYASMSASGGTGRF